MYFVGYGYTAQLGGIAQEEVANLLQFIGKIVGLNLLGGGAIFTR